MGLSSRAAPAKCGVKNNAMKPPPCFSSLEAIRHEKRSLCSRVLPRNPLKFKHVCVYTTYSCLEGPQKVISKVGRCLTPVFVLSSIIKELTDILR